jgi:hypothetical protein
MSDLQEMSSTYDFSAYCEEGGTFGVYVEVAGQQRFGPSLCMLNSLFAPVVLIALAVLGGTRISELKRLPDVKPYTNFPSVYDTAQFGLAAAGILLGIASAAMASERADVRIPEEPPKPSQFAAAFRFAAMHSFSDARCFYCFYPPMIPLCRHRAHPPAAMVLAWSLLRLPNSAPPYSLLLQTIAGLVIFAKFAGIMGLIAIENSKNVLRGKNVKCFWVIDFLYTM